MDPWVGAKVLVWRGVMLEVKSMRDQVRAANVEKITYCKLR